MKTGKVIKETSYKNQSQHFGVFHIHFSQSVLGPYSHVFTRENLYFDEEFEERGSHFFPLKDTQFKNSELFLETDDIVVCIGQRGSFSGEAKRFLEIVNLKTKNKYRFYPDEVSLVYNTKDEIVIYYKKGKNHKKLLLEIKTLEKVSETSSHMSAFFKLLFEHKTGEYRRLIFKAKGRSKTLGYFSEEVISNEKTITKDIPWLNMSYLKEPDGQHSIPEVFIREDFLLRTVEYEKIDVWEASLTGIL